MSLLNSCDWLKYLSRPPVILSTRFRRLNLRCYTCRMRIEELEYELPSELIAQRPLERRDASRMLLLDRIRGGLQDRLFANLPDLLRGDEVLVYNNARVIPARLFGKRRGLHSQKPSRATQKEQLQRRVEVFLTRRL